MKIVLIGAGSYVFAPAVLHDAIVDHRLAGAELVMVDVAGEMAELMAGVGRAMARDAGADLRVSSTSDRLAALPGADFVIFSAAVQGARRWNMDAEILGRHGLGGQLRECGGMGGLGYALRTITLAMDVARDMERLCPRARFLDCANPLPRVVTAINKYSSITAVGFCSVAWGGQRGYARVAGWLGRDIGSFAATTAGLNHFAWLLEVRDRKTGEDLLPAVKERIQSGQGRDFEVLRRWLERFGGVPCSGVDHTGEYLPLEPGIHYRAKPPFHGDEKERQARMNLMRDISEGKSDWRELLKHRSWERPVDVAAALGRGMAASFDMVNISNEGYIREIPDGRVVEVPATAASGELKGRAVPPLPDGAAQMCRAISDVHELVAEGAVKGARSLLERAIEIDPAITDKKAARAALDEMLLAHADVLPQFAG